MDEGLIARRYAKAVFRYAQELNAADAVYEKMKLFEKNYIAHPDLQKALLNPLLLSLIHSSPRLSESNRERRTSRVFVC